MAVLTLPEGFDLPGDQRFLEELVRALHARYIADGDDPTMSLAVARGILAHAVGVLGYGLPAPERETLMVRVLARVCGLALNDIHEATAAADAEMAARAGPSAAVH